MVMPLMTDAERTALALEDLARIEAADEARQDKWDRHFLGLAHYNSRMSKDPSTKVGAVITRPDQTVVSLGFNGFARNMRDDAELYADREQKYARIVHGEMNAIFSAKQSVDGCTLYTTPFAPCERCAVMVIQAGIRRVVTVEPSAELKERWGDALDRAASYFAEAGVELKFIDVDLESLLPTPLKD